jgi:PAS domain S-box-containing protein
MKAPALRQSRLEGKGAHSIVMRSARRPKKVSTIIQISEPKRREGEKTELLTEALGERMEAALGASETALDASKTALDASKTALDASETALDASKAALGASETTLDASETALKELELRYRRLFETAKDGILILDAETGMVIDVNPFLIITLRFSHEQFLSKAIWELGFFKDIWANEEKFTERKDEEYVRYEYLPFETSDGERIDVEFVSNLYLVNGRKVIQCNVRDVTARREAEEALRQLNASLEQRVLERTIQLEAANKELEAFSYSVSHDLRAPLRAISGFSRIVLEDYSAALDADALRYLHQVEKSAGQMGQLIDDLLMFSRTGRQALTIQTVSTTAIVNACLSDLQDMRENRHVAIVVGELPDCEADASLLKQVWLNLLANALKYTRKRDAAVITIGSERETGTDSYFVQDNGAGFDMKYADKLFGVFQRLHLADDYEGTGVGLALVQRIVQRHGGRVWAEAKLNLGATFHFTLTGGQHA